METGENKKIQKIVAKSYNELFFERYHLSIEISKTNLSYCILNIDNFHYESFFNSKINENNISEILKSEGLLENRFFSKSVLFSGFPNTLIPKSILEDNSEERIFRLNHGNAKNLFCESLKNLSIENITAIPSDLTKNIEELFPDIFLKTRSSFLIDHLFDINNNELRIFICNQESSFEIIIFKDKKLILQNIFNCNTIDDKIYYILFCLQTIDASLEKITVQLFGNANDKKFTNLLSNYIPNISLLNRSNKLYLSSEFDKITTNRFFSLFSQILCV